ncbi:hypothetical protein [Chitinimonas lacunae]|uniref:DUF3313 domain-containing protein n=1 Tax=Chitinimonas lacunae TaxID=1963018 RepID=A0ABV8MS30_9NEIS
MMFKKLALMAATAGMLLLSGCASIQQPVPVKPAFWQGKDQGVAIVVPTLPKAVAMKVGNQGLLDVAINSALANPLETHLNSLDLSEFNRVAQKINDGLAAKGFSQVTIVNGFDLSKLQEFKDQKPGTGFAKQDFRPLAASMNSGKAVVLKVMAAGTVRAYYGFIPLGAPSAKFMVEAQIVNLKDNSLEWYQNFDRTQPVADPWDQSPNFPNVTNAVYQNVDAVVNDIVRELTTKG